MPLLLVTGKRSSGFSRLNTSLKLMPSRIFCHVALVDGLTTQVARNDEGPSENSDEAAPPGSPTTKPTVFVAQ